MKCFKAIHFGIIISTILFVILTSVAIIFYPGGSWIDSSSSGFSFSSNFFSDLSRRITFLGETNLISSILFTSAMSLVGIAVICFFVMMLHNFLIQKEFRKITIAIFVLGVICALVYLSIGFTPFDQYPGTHSILIVLSFCLILFVTITYAARIFLIPEYPNFFGWIFVVFFLLCCSYLLVILSQNFTEFLLYNKLRAISQKVVVYTGITFLIIQTIGSLRYRIMKISNEDKMFS